MKNKKLEALTALLEIQKVLQEKEKQRVEEVKPLNDVVRGINEAYKKENSALIRKDAELREKVESLYASEGTYVVEGVGSLVFPETYNFEVTDAKLVPRDYLMIDTAKVKEAIGKGIRNIKGLKIEKKYWGGMQVREWKEGEGE